MKQIFKLCDDGRIIVHLKKDTRKECVNLHQAILYARRK